MSKHNSVREDLEELKKLCEGCGEISWCGLTNGNHMLCLTCDDIAYAALTKLIEALDRERRSNAALISAGNDLEAVSTANGINMERWFAIRDHWRNCVDEHSALQSGGSND